MKVVLGGSRQLSFLPEEVMDNLNSWMRDGVEFLVGEAKGTDAKFQEFHAENPQVYTALRDRALQLKRKGWNHYGIKAIVEVVRFHRALETTDPDFKLNNNYSSRYARILMDEEPELAGFFQTRELKS